MPQNKPEPRRVPAPIVGPSPTFIEKLRGKRTSDIPLPNDTGQVDPRLKKKKKSIFDRVEDFEVATGGKAKK